VVGQTAKRGKHHVDAMASEAGAADRLAFHGPRHRPHHHAMIATQGYKPRRRRRVYSAHCPPPASLAQACMAPAGNLRHRPTVPSRRRASVQFPGMPGSPLFPFLLVYLHCSANHRNVWVKLDFSSASENVILLVTGS